MAADRMQRRLAAILAADIAGYSRLTGADEEGTVARTAGLDADRRIAFRVGIHLGDVLVQPDGDLLGDGVNIAARLEGICEPDGICLSRAAHEQVEGKVEAAFSDLGEQSLKNIARPVRVFALILQDNATTPANAGVHRADAAASTSMAPRVRGGGKKELGAEQKREAAPRLSIVVLPFANIGGDPEQDYFVDGVTESLTTDLSRISGSFVIARNTAFTYKGKPVEVKQIGRELNVRYVLEGSVQKGGNRLRVSVQLIDAETSNHLWAERFDKPVADLLDMQDEIVARLANQLRSELIAVEARRAERVPNPDSMDLFFRGMASVHIGGSPANLSQARDLFERAVTLDPTNVEALVGLAHCDAYLGGGLFGRDRAARLAAAENVLDRALSLAPNHASAHRNLGHLMVFTNRATQALSELERALRLDPNLADAHASMGLAKFALGRAEETEGHIDDALRLSPRDVTAYLWVAFTGFAKANLGQDEQAAARLRRAIELNRNYPVAHFWLGAVLARLGRLDDAARSVQVGLTFDPRYSIRNARAGAMSDNPVYLAQREHIYEAMRKAGVPEG